MAVIWAANSRAYFSSPVSRYIPKLIEPKDHAELLQRATELKRMATPRLQKLNGER